jgi:ATP-binding cassette subfamily C protein CydD
MILPSSTKPQSSFKWLFGQLHSIRAWIFVSVGAGLFGGLSIVVQARLIADIIHGAFMDKIPRDRLLPLFWALAAVVVIRAFLSWVRETAGFQAGAQVRKQLRMSILRHLADAGPIGIGGRSTGTLATAVMEQVEALHNFFAHYLPQLALAVIVPLTLVAFVFPINWAAGGILLITAPLIPLFMILIGMGAESISQRNFQALARMSAHFLDTLQGLGTLKLFGRSRSETEAIGRVTGQYRRQTMKVLRVAFLSSAVLEFFSAFSIALVAIYLGLRFLGYIEFGGYEQPLTFADGLFILILAPDFYLPLRELGTHYHSKAEAVGAAEEIQKMVSFSTTPSHGAHMLPWPMEQPLSIRLENIHYGFDEGARPALCGVNLDIGPGQRVAVVGSSGAGKTTIGQLLLAFDQPGKGRILINNTDLSLLVPNLWRQCVSWIGQRPVLFHGTIRDNIRMGKPDASDTEIEAAATAALVSAFTDRLAGGLETTVGEMGMGLSRGQAQRVALARAFVKNAPVVLLDEPTAALDSQTDSKIMDAIFRFCTDKTLIFMTHRLDRLHQVDRIAVLSEGKLYEQGSFAELADAGGMFSQLLESMPDDRYDPGRP